MKYFDTVVIDRIEREEDEVSLYGPKKPGSKADSMFGEFRIAATPEEAADLHVGDEIEYESVGINLGFFNRKLSP